MSTQASAHDTVGGAPSGRMVVAPGIAKMVDLYWMALVYVQNLLEDVEGADGRPAYLHSLKYRLIETLQEMDGALWPVDCAAPPVHRAAFALDNGIRSLGLTGQELQERVGLGQGALNATELGKLLVDLGNVALAALPGEMPRAQGVQGQREVLRAMRTWSAAAEQTGEDLSFLASRFEEM